MNLVALRGNATVLDELDIACSSATLAEDNQLIRPVLNLRYDIKNSCLTHSL